MYIYHIGIINIHTTYMTTQEHVLSEIKKILKDERTKSEMQFKVGTSSDGFMGREEDKLLNVHFKDLQSELTKTNIRSLDERITGTHLSNLYSVGKTEHNWPEFDFDEQYQQQVFTLLSFSPFAKSTVPVSDFLKQYILLENKIKMKKDETEYIYNELRKNSSEYENQLNKYASLPSKDNSIQLGVTIFEVSNLKINDDNNLYMIKLSVDNHPPNTTNASPCFNNSIIFNKNYTFELTRRNLALRVELLRQNALLRKFTPFATSVIPLEDIDPEQQRVENVYDLYSIEHSEQNISVGQIRLKLHYVYDGAKYFKTLVNKTKNDCELTLNCLRSLSRASELMDKPFGLIMTNEIDMVKEITADNNIYNKISQLNLAVRLSVIHTQGLSTYKDRTSNELMNVTISKDEGVKRNLIISNVLLYICLCLSAYCCIIRNDILNLLTFALIWFMQHVQENILINDYIKWMLLYTEISDVLWVLAKIAKYVQLKEEEVKYATFLRGSVFIAGLVNLCIKVKILVAYFKRKK